MNDLGMDLYRKMFLCREAEETIRRNYASDVMKTPMHMSMGEEAIAAGVCHALGADDQIVGTYRSHGLYLCRTGETDQFFAEMYGKDTGMARGKAGSMHLSSPDGGLICTSAIVSTGIPVAVGAAFANQRLQNGRVVAAFFGDGATDEGVFWESLNAASLWRLPVLFICEDNGIAVHIPSQQRRGYDSLPDLVSGFRCKVFQDETTDVERIHALTQQALRCITEEGIPVLMNLRYYRYLEHVGVNEDFCSGYRDPAEYEAWKERDPVQFQRRRLLGIGRQEEIETLEAEIRKQVRVSVEKAELAPFPNQDAIYQGLYA